MDSDINATEAAERKAEELGVDLNEVEGTGADGRVTAPDVEKAAEAPAEDAIDESDPTAVDAARSAVSVEMAGKPGYPAKTVDGLDVLIVNKQASAQGADVLTDDAGNQYTMDAATGLLVELD